jgi:hypothetical protein
MNQNAHFYRTTESELGRLGSFEEKKGRVRT